MLETQKGFKCIEFLHKMPNNAGILFHSFEENIVIFTHYKDTAKSLEDFVLFKLFIDKKTRKPLGLVHPDGISITMPITGYSGAVELFENTSIKEAVQNGLKDHTKYKISRSFKKLFINSCKELLKQHSSCIPI